MKKFLALALFLGLFSGVAFADINRALGEYNLSGNMAIKNVTISATNSVQSITFNVGTIVDFTLQANPGVRFCLGGTTADPYFTLVTGEAYSPPLPIPLPINTVFYFYTYGTVPATVEAIYTYR